MPMLCFFPWATTTEPLQFGRFHLSPAGQAIGSGSIGSEYGDAVAAILEAYGKARAVDQASVPLLRRDDLAFTADLPEESIAEYFEFRTRLTFAVLSARHFFSVHYANSDNVRLVIQGFTPEHAGASTIQSRRRDGATNNLVPKGNLSILRPFHISGWCEFPRDVDQPLLDALETAARQQLEVWPSIAEAIWLFVGANSDSPDVSMHAELIDVASAFGRLAATRSRKGRAWDEDDTVSAFVRVLPAPEKIKVRATGPKTSDQRVSAGLAKGKSLREIWLRDLYVLRSQVGHGHVEAPPYRASWTEREHLLLAAMVFPLYVKALLHEEGLYTITTNDELTNIAFDALATLSPFETTQDDDSRSPWSDVMLRAHSRQLASHLAATYGVDAEDEEEDGEDVSEDV